MEEKKRLRPRYNIKPREYQRQRFFNALIDDIKVKTGEVAKMKELLGNVVYEALTSGEHTLWTEEEWEAFQGAPRLRIDQAKCGGYFITGPNFGLTTGWKPNIDENSFWGSMKVQVLTDRSTPAVANTRRELKGEDFTNSYWADKIRLTLEACGREDYKVKNALNQYLDKGLNPGSFLEPQLGKGWLLQDLLNFNEDWFWLYIRKITYWGSEADSLLEDDEETKNALESEDILTALGALKGLLGQ